jgi:hypothetical protein
MNTLEKSAVQLIAKLSFRRKLCQRVPARLYSIAAGRAFHGDFDRALFDNRQRLGYNFSMWYFSSHRPPQITTQGLKPGG